MLPSCSFSRPTFLSPTVPSDRQSTFSRASSSQAPRAADASLPGKSPISFCQWTKTHHIPHTACSASGTTDLSLRSKSGVSCGVSSPLLQLPTATTSNMPKVGTYALSTVSQARPHFHARWGTGVSLSRLLSVSSRSRHPLEADNSTRCTLTPSLINRMTAGYARRVKTTTEGVTPHKKLSHMQPAK
ncbi:hypothetical protein V8C26DRAFT_21517 [Trichoderma gracile]